MTLMLYSVYLLFISLRILFAEDNRGIAFECSNLCARRSCRIETEEPQIKLVTVQRNEVETLSDWLQYHSYLFGIHNIVVIDHSSTNPNVLNLLSLYRECGATIVKIPSTATFQQKDGWVTNELKRFSKSFLIPLDVDEFIVKAEELDTGVSIVHDREEILSEIARLPIDGRKYKFLHTFDMLGDNKTCDANLEYADRQDQHYRRSQHASAMIWKDIQIPEKRVNLKTFYYSKGFISTDTGNHYGTVQNDHGITGGTQPVSDLPLHYVFTNLSLLHYSTPSYYGARLKFIRGAVAYGYAHNYVCYPTQPGSHYCKDAPLYRNGSSQRARDTYVELCSHRTWNLQQRTETSLQWFAQNTMSLEELLRASGKVFEEDPTSTDHEIFELYGKTRSA